MKGDMVTYEIRRQLRPLEAAPVDTGQIVGRDVTSDVRSSDHYPWDTATLSAALRTPVLSSPI